MNIHQLRCAAMVARFGSQTRAAEALYMSQPNLSKALKELEQACGFRIFTRTGTGMQPTRKGEAFLKSARAVLDQLDAMDAAYLGRNRDLACLSVAMPRAGYLFEAFTAFVNALDPHDGMELALLEADTAEVVREVSNREADIGIVRYPLQTLDRALNALEEQGLHYVLFYTFRPVVVFSARHPLAAEKSLQREMLAPYAEVFFDDEPRPVAPEECAPEAGAELRQIRVSDRGSQWELLSASPGCYMWSSPLPKALEKRYGLAQRHCEDVRADVQDALIYPKGYALSRWEQAFYNEVRKEIEALRGL